jgi:competence protein ComEC
MKPELAAWIFGGVALCLLTALWLSLKPKGITSLVLAIAVFIPVGGALHLVRFRTKPPYHVSNMMDAGKKEWNIKGQVVREPEVWFWRRPFTPGDAGEKRWFCRIRVKSLSPDGDRWERSEGGITVFGEGKQPDLLAGDIIRFRGSLRANRQARNPGETDFAVIFARKDSWGTTSVSGEDDIELLERPAWYASIPIAIGRMRCHVKDKLLSYGGIPPFSAALLFGERSRLGKRRQLLMQESGTIHFLAISGLHAGMFAAFVYVLVSRIRVPVWSRSLLLICSVWLYVVFTGSHISSIRAAGMISLMALAPVVRRRSDPISTLVGTACLILLFMPQALFSVGFQLTFAAVWAIFCIYPRLKAIVWPWGDLLERLQSESELSFRNLFAQYCSKYLLLSLSVWVTVAPLLACHFNHFSIYTPFLNLLLWPLILILVLCSFVLVPLLFTGSLLSGFVLWLSEFLGEKIEFILQLCSHLPAYVIYCPSPPIWLLLPGYLVLGFWALRRDFSWGRKLFVVGVICISVCYMAIELLSRHPGRMSLTVADVGHGQCLVFRMPKGEKMMYDAGAFSASRARCVAEMLWHYRSRRIPLTVISHRDTDHCSFIPYLARRFSMGTLVMAPLRNKERDQKIGRRLAELFKRRLSVAEGSRISGGGLECRVLHPDMRFLTGKEFSSNNQSVTMMCEYGGVRFLLMGDLEMAGLQRLIDRYGEDLLADVLILPHHGAWTEALPAFIEHVKPAVAIASRTGKLSPKTESLLSEKGVGVWSTAHDGAVIVTLFENYFDIEGFVSGRTQRRPVRENILQ